MTTQAETVLSLPGVKVGLNCDVAIESADGIGVYKSRIQDVERNRLTVDIPTSRGQEIVPATGDQVEVRVHLEDGGTTILNSEVIGRQSQPLPVMIVRVLSLGQKQQRSFFRVNVAVRPIDCALWYGGGEGAFWRPIVGTLVNLGGGGVGLGVPEHLAEGARLKLRFPIPYGGGECASLGEVRSVRAYEGGGGGSARWIAGVQFQEITRRSRERLVKAVQRTQSEERRLAAAQEA